MDITGVGRPVYDHARDVGLTPTGILSTSGSEATFQSGIWHVPKAHLIAAALIAIDAHRCHASLGLPYGDVLMQELYTYRLKQSPTTGHVTYESWREKDHDDLVFCLAMTTWWGEKQAREQVGPLDLRRGMRGTTQPGLDIRAPRQTSRRPGHRWALDPDASATAENWDEQKRDAYLRGDSPKSPFRPERR